MKAVLVLWLAAWICLCYLVWFDDGLNTLQTEIPTDAAENVEKGRGVSAR